MIRFRLTLPSGFPRAFKRKARRYWDVEGDVVGNLLSFDRPQTLAQLRDAYQRRYGRSPHGDVTLDHTLAYALVRLAEHGFVRIEPAVSFALDTQTPLAFRLASYRPATAAAGAAWLAYGRIASVVLAAGRPMTLDQIVTAVRQTAVGQRVSLPAVTPAAVAHSLLALAGAGIVEILQMDAGSRGAGGEGVKGEGHGRLRSSLSYHGRLLPMLQHLSYPLADKVGIGDTL